MAETDRDAALPAFPAAPRPPAGGVTSKHVGAATLAAIAGVSIATATGMSNDTRQHESSGRIILSAYPDAGGVWSICDGIIRWPNGRPVRRGDTATPEQCDELRYTELIRHTRPLIACLPVLYGRDNQVRALVDISYNIGAGGVCTGSVGRDIRAGDWAAASLAILPYDRVTFTRPQPGRDCVRTRRGWACKVKGLSVRRQQNQWRFDQGRPAQGVR
jgi:lysozyme